MMGISAWRRAILAHGIARAIGRQRMAILLATLVLLLLAAPIADIVPEARPIITAATVAFLLSALQQVDTHPLLRLPSRLLVGLWLILSLPLPQLDRAWDPSAAAVILAGANLCVLWLVAQRLIKADRVDAELLCTALGAYLLLGIFWASTYEIIAAVAPASFSAGGKTPPDRSLFLYFSFTTLTTTGYGDVTAINPAVRMWTIFESIIGTMYNAIVIARLVSLYGSPTHAGKEQSAVQPDTNK
jgi:hypothetical protein